MLVCIERRSSSSIMERDELRETDRGGGGD
jgi:hypothetical protein